MKRAKGGENGTVRPVRLRNSDRNKVAELLTAVRLPVKRRFRVTESDIMRAALRFAWFTKDQFVDYCTRADGREVRDKGE